MEIIEKMQKKMEIIKQIGKVTNMRKMTKWRTKKKEKTIEKEYKR